MKNVKFKIENTHVAEAVSKKLKSLAESGVINHPNVYPEGYDVYPLFVYVDKNGYVSYGVDSDSFDKTEETQIHYLNFLMDTIKGRLFKNDFTQNVYLQLDGTAYWVVQDSLSWRKNWLEWHPFELYRTLGKGNELIDVNENVLK